MKSRNPSKKTKSRTKQSKNTRANKKGKKVSARRKIEAEKVKKVTIDLGDDALEIESVDLHEDSTKHDLDEKHYFDILNSLKTQMFGAFEGKFKSVSAGFDAMLGDYSIEDVEFVGTSNKFGPSTKIKGIRFNVDWFPLNTKSLTAEGLVKAYVRLTLSVNRPTWKKRDGSNGCVEIDIVNKAVKVSFEWRQDDGNDYHYTKDDYTE
jgi:hypothetical protein